MFVYVCMYVSVSVCLCVHVRMFVCLYVLVCLCVCVCVCVCVFYHVGYLLCFLQGRGLVDLSDHQPPRNQEEGDPLSQKAEVTLAWTGLLARVTLEVKGQ